MDLLVASNVLLWLAVIALAILLLGLARQVGLLHERSAPLGAMIADKGPDIGDPAPRFEVQDYRGNPLIVGGAREDGQDLLLLFLAPTCPMCKKLLPTARSMARSERLQVVVVSDGEADDHARFLNSHNLGTIPYVVSSEIGIRYQVGRVPHAVLVDADGIIRAKGLVNTREHLESLVEAKALHQPSLQAYLKDKTAPADSQPGQAPAARQLN